MPFTAKVFSFNTKARRSAGFFLSLSILAILVVIVCQSCSGFFCLECVGYKIFSGRGLDRLIPRFWIGEIRFYRKLWRLRVWSVRSTKPIASYSPAKECLGHCCSHLRTARLWIEPANKNFGKIVCCFKMPSWDFEHATPFSSPS